MPRINLLIALSSVSLISFAESRDYTIYFVRHAESIWNEYKSGTKGTAPGDDVPCEAYDSSSYEAPLNSPKEKVYEWGSASSSSPPSSPSRGWGLIRSAVKGTAAAASNAALANYLDAGLSPMGIRQAKCLGEWMVNQASNGNVEAQRLLGIVDFDQASIVVSNLRRTRQTFLYAFKERCKPSTSGEKITPMKVSINNSLQEEGCAIDAKPNLNEDNIEFDFTAAGVGDSKSSRCPMILPINDGGIKDTCASDTMMNQKFPKFLSFITVIGNFDAVKRMTNPFFIVTGHSTWYRDFVRQYMGYDRGTPNALENRLAQVKLGNASVVRFTFQTDSDGLATSGRIVPGSTKLIYGYVKKSD